MNGIPGTDIVGYTCNAEITCPNCIGDVGVDCDDMPIFACSDDADTYCMTCGCHLITGEKAPRNNKRHR